MIGGSLGGMQVLEWAITFPQRVRSIVPIATCAQATAQQIAWGAIGRRAIRLDPKWRGGDYYDAEPGDGPAQGLAIARMVAQVTFRSDNVFTEKFGRELADGATGSSDRLDLWQRFEVERYLDHHGDKLIRRFDANSYLIIGKAMDLHDVGRGRGGAARRRWRRITVPTLTMGIWSDMLYPAYQQRQIRDLLVGGGHAVRVRRDRLTARPRRVPDQPRSDRARRSPLPRPGREELTTRRARQRSSAASVVDRAALLREPQGEHRRRCRCSSMPVSRKISLAARRARRAATRPSRTSTSCAS